MEICGKSVEYVRLTHLCMSEQHHPRVEQAERAKNFPSTKNLERKVRIVWFVTFSP